MNEITRSRLKLIGILLVVVVLLHIVAIKVLIATSHSGAKDKTESTSPRVPEPELLSGPGGAAGAARVKAGSVEKIPMSKSHALDWSGAVYGDIRSLPEPDKVKVGILVDLNTRKVIWAKRPKDSVPVASMTKLMTLLLTFEEMERNGNVTLDSKVQVTRGPASLREGVINLDVREVFSLRDLLMAVTIKSANDAALQVAEFIGGGSSEQFVERMNARAFELGMPGTRFTNPNGLPNKKSGDSVSSAEGMFYLAEAVMQYPQIMEWAGTKQTFIRDGKTELTNTNKLILPHYPGVDGLKTGYTHNAGSCLTFTCLRDGRRLVGVVAGVKGSVVRDRFCRKLLDWAYKTK